ncbi:hypothetical protein V1477_021136 [Vespula maculifrons]|uniref:Uncharacterized protein n=1 Tax=Vespula maculifrons TaxID=7453 RepID=A0ABD2AH92_VESMC
MDNHFFVCLIDIFIYWKLDQIIISLNRYMSVNISSYLLERSEEAKKDMSSGKTNFSINPF